MMFTTPDFAPSGAHNKMTENENFASFLCKFKIEVQFSGRGKDKI